MANHPPREHACINTGCRIAGLIDIGNSYLSVALCFWQETRTRVRRAQLIVSPLLWGTAISFGTTLQTDKTNKADAKQKGGNQAITQPSPSTFSPPTGPASPLSPPPHTHSALRGGQFRKL